MLDFALVLLVYGFHNQLDKHWRLLTEFFQIDLLRVVGAVHSLTVMEKISHLDTEQQRFFGEFYVKCVIATIFSDNRKIGFLLERLESRFDAKHVLRTVGKSGDKVLIAEVNIDNLRGEDDVRCLFIRNLQCVRGNHAIEADFAGKTVKLVAVGVVRAVHVHVVFGYRFSVWRHVVIGVFGCLAFGKSRGCHSDNGDERN